MIFFLLSMLRLLPGTWESTKRYIVLKSGSSGLICGSILMLGSKLVHTVTSPTGGGAVVANYSSLGRLAVRLLYCTLIFGALVITPIILAAIIF